MRHSIPTREPGVSSRTAPPEPIEQTMSYAPPRARSAQPRGVFVMPMALVASGHGNPDAVLVLPRIASTDIQAARRTRYCERDRTLREPPIESRPSKEIPHVANYSAEVETGNRDSRFPVAVASTACAARTKRAGSFSSTPPAFTSDFTDSSSTTSNKAVAQSGLLKVHCRCRCTSLEGRYAHRRRRLRLEGRRVSWRRAEVSARRHRGPLFLPSSDESRASPPYLVLLRESGSRGPFPGRHGGVPPTPQNRQPRHAARCAVPPTGGG